MESTQRLERAFRETLPSLPPSKEIEHLFQKFTSILLKAFQKGEGFIEEDLHFILRALCFAADKHSFQHRKDADQTPYIAHPLEVACLLVDLGNVRDPDILISALLHDTIEDTSTTLEELLDEFNQKIAWIVCEVTDDKTLTKQERKQLQILNAPSKSAGAAQLTLADKLANLMDLQRSPPLDWSEKRIQEYFLWASQVVDRLPWVNAPLKQQIDNIIIANAASDH